MTHRDIYIKFMIGYDKANVTSSYPSLTEYEVATFLDKAYLALIAQKVTGNNSRHIGFEQDLKVTEDLGPLIVTQRIYNINREPLPYVHNALSCEIPSDWLYFVSGELQRGIQNPKTWDLRLVSHQVASKFYTTAYNIPWVKRPVCYIEDDTIYTLYDSIYQADGLPSLSFTYIKAPKKFMVDDGESNDASSSSDTNPYAYCTNGYINEQTITLKVGDQFRIIYQNGSEGEIFLEYNSAVLNAMDNTEGIVDVTAVRAGVTSFALRSSHFENWSFILYITVEDDNEIDPPIVTLLPTNTTNLQPWSEYAIKCEYADHHAIPNISIERGGNTSLASVNMTTGGIISIRTNEVRSGENDTFTVRLTSIDHYNWDRTIEYKVARNATPSIPEFDSEFENGVYYVKGNIEYTIYDSEESVLNPIFELDENNAVRLYVTHFGTNIINTSYFIYCYDEESGQIVRKDVSSYRAYDIIKQRIIYALRYNYSVAAVAGVDIEAKPETPTAYIIIPEQQSEEPSVTNLSRSLIVPATDTINVNNGYAVSAISSDTSIASTTISGGIVTVQSILKSNPTVNVTVFTETGYYPIVVTYTINMEHDNFGDYFPIDFIGDPSETPVMPELGDPSITVLSVGGQSLLNSSSEKLASPGTYQVTASYEDVGSAILYLVASTNTDCQVGDALNTSNYQNYRLYPFTDSVTDTVQLQSSQTLRFYLVEDNKVKQVYGTLKHTSLQPAVLNSQPAARTISYNGEQQNLVTAGQVTGGTLEYSLDNSTWSTSIPKAKVAGDYNVYYRISPDANHSASSTYNAINVTISKRQLNLIWSNTTFVYDGSLHCPTVTASNVIQGDTVNLAASGEQSALGTYTATAYFIIGDDTTNYKLPIPATTTFTITEPSAVTGGNTRDINCGASDEIVLNGGNAEITSVISDSINQVEVEGWSTRSAQIRAYEPGAAKVTVYTSDNTTLEVNYKVHPTITRTSRVLTCGESGDPDAIVTVIGANAIDYRLSEVGYITANATNNTIEVTPVSATPSGNPVVLTVITSAIIDGVAETIDVYYTINDAPSAAPNVANGDSRTLTYGDYEILTVDGNVHHAQSFDTMILSETENYGGYTSNVQVQAIGVGTTSLGIWLTGSTNTLNNSTTPDIIVRYTVTPKLMSPAPNIASTQREVVAGNTDTITVTNGSADYARVINWNGYSSVSDYIRTSIVNGEVKVQCRNITTATVAVTMNNGEIVNVDYTIVSGGNPPYIDGSSNRTIYTDRTIETIKVALEGVSRAVSSDTSVVTTSLSGSNVAVMPHTPGTADVTITTSGNHTLVVHYTVLQAPARPYLTRSGDATEDANGAYYYLAVGETDTITLNNGTLYSWYTTGGYSQNPASTYTSYTTNGNSMTLKAIAASPGNALIEACASTYEKDGNDNQNWIKAYHIVPYLPLEAPGVKIEPLDNMTERVPSTGYVSDTIFDDYVVLNARIQGNVGIGNTYVDLEYPILALDGDKIKALVKYDSSTNNYKYLCKTQGGYTLSNVEEDPIVSKYLANQAKRAWRKYGDFTGSSTTTYSDAVRLGANTNINVTEYINPMYVAPES